MPDNYYMPPAGGQDVPQGWDNINNSVTGVLPAAAAWFQNPGMGYFPGNPVAGLNQMQRDSWGVGLDAASNIATTGQGMSNMYGSYLSGGGPQVNARQVGIGSRMNFFDNPYLHQSVQNVSDEMGRNFNRNVIPGIDLESVSAGQTGSSRHGVAQGIAASDLTRQVGDASTGMYSDLYNAGMGHYLDQRGQDISIIQGNQQADLDAQLANADNAYGALNLMPQWMNAYSQSQMTPYAMMQGIGGQQRNYAQDQLNAQMDMWNWTRDNPLNRLNAYANIVSAMNTGGQVNTSQDPNWGAGLAGLGGALAGMNWGGGGGDSGNGTVPSNALDLGNMGFNWG
jgi:hypothetical protein